MKKDLFQLLRNYILAGSLGLATALSPAKANAADLTIGLGWEPCQLDNRTTFSVNENKVKTTLNNLLLKCSTSKEYLDEAGNETGDIGIFGILNTPWKYVSTPNGSNHGLADISVLGGTRGSKYKLFLNSDNLHFLGPYIGMGLPTGSATGKVPLESGDHKTSFGIFATYYPNANRNVGLNLQVQYTARGDNAKGKNLPDEILVGAMPEVNLGWLIDSEIARNLRAGVGYQSFKKENGDSLSSVIWAIRYALFKDGYIQVRGKHDTNSHILPKGNELTVRMGYNFKLQ